MVSILDEASADVADSDKQDAMTSLVTEIVMCTKGKTQDSPRRPDPGGDCPRVQGTEVRYAPGPARWGSSMSWREGSSRSTRIW